MAREHEVHDESLRWDGKPGAFVFAGIRKLIECMPALDQPENHLGKGTEVTYSLLRLASEDDVAKLVNGDEVPLIYEE